MPADDGVRLTRADRVLLGALYAPVVPVGLAVAGAWLTLPLAGATAAGVAALAGLAVGGLVDAVAVPRWVRRGFGAPMSTLAGVYAFYSVVTYVVFMGMPVPQLALGLVAGAFAGRGRRDVTRTRAVTVVGIGVLTAVSTAMALGNPSTGYDAERILGAPVPAPVLVALVLLGVPVLVLAQWLVTGAGARLGGRRAGRQRTGSSRDPEYASATSSRASSAETTSTVFVA